MKEMRWANYIFVIGIPIGIAFLGREWGKAIQQTNAWFDSNTALSLMLLWTITLLLPYYAFLICYYAICIYRKRMAVERMAKFTQAAFYFIQCLFFGYMFFQDLDFTKFLFFLSFWTVIFEKALFPLNDMCAKKVMLWDIKAFLAKKRKYRKKSMHSESESSK